jgi:hypothetical protein
MAEACVVARKAVSVRANRRTVAALARISADRGMASEIIVIGVPITENGGRQGAPSIPYMPV